MLEAIILKPKKSLILSLVLFLLLSAFCLRLILPDVAFYLNFGILLSCLSLLLVLCFHTRALTTLLTLTFLFRLILAFLAEIGLDPGLPGRGKNGTAFLEDGQKIYLTWIHPVLELSVKYSYEKWPQVIAGIYYLIGDNFLNVIVFNCFLGTLLVYEIYRGTQLIWNTKAALVGATIYAFIPYIAGLSAVALREMVIIYPAVLSFRFFLSWLKEGKIINFFKAFIASGVALLFHGGLIILTVFYIWTFFAKEVKLKTKRGVIIGLIGFVSVSAISVTAFNLEVGRGKLNFFYRLYEGTNEDHETFINLLASGMDPDKSSNQYRKPFIPTSYFDFLTHVPEYVIPFYFYPYPWLTYRVSFSFLNGIFSLFCFIAFLIYRKEIFRNHLARKALIASVLIMAVYAIGTTEYAAAVRHRAKAMPFMAMIFAPFFIRSFHFLFNKKPL